ncbi:MAG: response regulator [Cyanobacteria bacterium J06621_8]
MTLANETAKRPFILLIDDEKEFQTAFLETVTEANGDSVTVQLASSAQEGLEIIKENERKSIETCAFIDYVLPDKSGDFIINKINQDYPGSVIKGILISAHKDKIELQKLTKRHDWLSFIPKPLNREEIQNSIDKFIGENSEISCYSLQLDEDTVTYLKKESEEINGLIRRTIEGTIEIGKRLRNVKERLKSSRDFRSWIETSNIQCDYSHALNFIRVYETFDSRKEELSQANIVPSMLYFLAAPSTPEELREDVIDKAKTGQSITIKEAKKLKQKYLEKQENSDDNISKVNKNCDDKPQQIVRVIPNKEKRDKADQNLWKLGEHLVYCGRPEDSRLRQLLPPKVSLIIDFSQEQTLDRNYIFPVDGDSIVTFSSRHKDLDLDGLSNIIRESIFVTTVQQETILFLELPSPKMLLIAETLECKCYVIENNYGRCQQIIKLWNDTYLSQDS